jgi:nucleotidyltransferase/DNA polymerase involved in DNA repair
MEPRQYQRRTRRLPSDAPALPHEHFDDRPLPVAMSRVPRKDGTSSQHQGIMHVRIEHFYCTMEEALDPSLHGQSFVIGTGTGRPNEPGRVIDASPAAQRLGLTPGMSLRRAYRVAPRTRFMPASYDEYQSVLQHLRELYSSYARVVESLPISDAFLDLSTSDLTFDTPVIPAERLCNEISDLGLTALIGVANGKTIAELAALMSRKDGRRGVLYIPPTRESSFVQTLPLTLLLRLRSNEPIQPELDEQNTHNADHAIDNGINQAELSETITHLRDFGITTFAQVARLHEEGLLRRLGPIGGWLYALANGADDSFITPDAPPASQNARVSFHHPADADETCNAIRKLSDYLSERLQEQQLKGQSIALILWPAPHTRLTRDLSADPNSPTDSQETLGGQMMLARFTDEADVITHHSLMLFAHYHRSGNHYQQVQLRIGDMTSTLPAHYPSRTNSRLTRKL